MNHIRIALSEFSTTLESVYIRTEEGLYRSSFEKLVLGDEDSQADGEGRYKVRLDDAKQAGEVELGVSNGLATAQGSRDLIKTDLTEEEVLWGVTERTKELAEWVIEQAEATKKNKDVSQAKQLLKTMKLAGDMKKCMED